MRLGLLADIHGDVQKLSWAIDQLRRQNVDRYVLLGDVIYDTRNADETVELLAACQAVGVWGNHELGLCVEPEDEVRDMYSEKVMAFFGTLQPRLELDDVVLSHTFPTEDGRDVLSFYDGMPEEEGWVARCFEQLPHRIMLVGHFHRWFAATPAGRLDWNGEKTLSFHPDERYFIVVNAVMDGFAAVVDDEQNMFIPIRLNGSPTS